MHSLILRPLILAFLLFSTFTVFDANAQGHHHNESAEHSHPGKIHRCDFRVAMRELWEDHVTWTRLFIVSAADNLAATESTTQRLLKNQVDIGNTVKGFYGEAAGDKLTELLKEHIIIAAQLLAAIKAGDSEGINTYNNKWLSNADDIAFFLHHANPQHWPLEDMKSMMRGHLPLTADEVVAYLSQNWEADLVAYDKVRKQMLHMADMLTIGIIKQFPEKFTSH